MGHLISSSPSPQQEQLTSPSGEAPRCGCSGFTWRPIEWTTKSSWSSLIALQYASLVFSSLSSPHLRDGVDNCCRHRMEETSDLKESQSLYDRLLQTVKMLAGPYGAHAQTKDLDCSLVDSARYLLSSFVTLISFLKTCLYSSWSWAGDNCLYLGSNNDGMVAGKWVTWAEAGTPCCNVAVKITDSG